MTTKSNSARAEGSTFGDRLLACVNKQGGPTAQEPLSKWFWENYRIKVSGAMINKYKNLDRLPRMDQCREYALAFGVCVDWLLTGREPEKPVESISRAELEVIDLWRTLAPPVQKIAYSQMKLLSIIGDVSALPEATDAEVGSYIMKSLQGLDKYSVHDEEPEYKPQR